MAILDAYSYYCGLGIAMMLGYVISSLRIERFIITAITMLPKQVSGTLAKKQMAASQEKSLVDSEESFPRMSILNGWTDENIFELERRAIFSKACDFTAQRMQNSDRV
jgi:ribose/xylose/arabinose/galactoside ABC-type transport system permease subunit